MSCLTRLYNVHPAIPSLTAPTGSLTYHTSCANINGSLSRYWPGKAPDWAEEGRDGGRDSDEEGGPSDEEEAVAAIAPPVILKASEDPRLRRLAEVLLLPLPELALPVHESLL